MTSSNYRSTLGTTTHSSALRPYMNWFAFRSTPQFADTETSDAFQVMKAAGFVGVQFGNGDASATLAACSASGLGVAHSGRIISVRGAYELAERFAGDGVHCATVHLGTGFEDDKEGACLIEAVLDASIKHKVPLYPETHRATLLQDMWRCVQFLRLFPELRLNADFSHWYTGSEMVYGDMEAKLAFLNPVFERVRFVHGRISDPGCIQVHVDLTADQPFVSHFRQMWALSFKGFLKTAKADDFICFTPELLAPDIFYARTVRNGAGQNVELDDRWQQTLLLVDLAKESFVKAQLTDASSV
jgi:hypothetical protein